MSDRFPNLGPMPTSQGHALSLSTGAASAQAGMVRIHRGSETRYVWPVHAPGWLSSGWHLGDDRQGGAVDALVSSPPHRPEPTPVPMPANQPGAAPEREVEPIEAHLPTNLLDLDAELAEAQGSATENDAVSASIGESERIATPAPADGAAAVAEAPQPDLEPANTPVAEPSDDTSEAPAADPVADVPAELAPEPTPTPSPARRGRPRKVRPEPEQQPTAEVMSEEQASTAQGSDEQQAPAAVLTTEGDDPFGLDPLL